MAKSEAYGVRTAMRKSTIKRVIEKSNKGKYTTEKTLVLITLRGNGPLRVVIRLF